MASMFPAYAVYGVDDSRVEEYTPSQTGGETLIPGEFAIYTGTTLKRATANPATLIGICETDSETHRRLTPNGKIPVRKFLPGLVICMSSTTTPSEATHLGSEYGITRDGTTGFWQVDTSKTGGNARVVVVRLNTTVNDERWFVEVLPEFIIHDTIDS